MSISGELKDLQNKLTALTLSINRIAEHAWRGEKDPKEVHSLPKRCVVPIRILADDTCALDCPWLNSRVHQGYLCALHNEELAYGASEVGRCLACKENEMNEEDD